MRILLPKKYEIVIIELQLYILKILSMSKNTLFYAITIDQHAKVNLGLESIYGSSIIRRGIHLQNIRCRIYLVKK